MRLALAAGIAVSALAFSALADEYPRVDANGDGWVTRAEASAMADRVFRDLDSNDDGKLDANDHSHDEMFEFHAQGPAPGSAHAARGERHVIIRRHDNVLEEHNVAPGAPPAPPHAPAPPQPPEPPRFMMIIASQEEADVNGDHALSLAEFRAQHLRFFDASDVNGDGRIKFEPPEPPEPPEAPEPPEPPRLPR